MSGKIRLLLAWLLGLAPLTAACQPIEVLWYTYADPSSTYVQSIKKLAHSVHTFPQSRAVRWKLTFFWPDSSAPAFEKYNVLVIHSGEAYSTGRYFTYLGIPDPKQRYVAPDFRGILRNKKAIEAARGERTFISGSDADVHAIRGDTGQAPHDRTRKSHSTCIPPIVGEKCWDGALGHLVNAVNWAASGRRLGIVSLVAAEFPGSRWWLDPNSFLRGELEGYVTIFVDVKKKPENTPLIPTGAQNYPLNAALTSQGLSNWRNAFHAGFSHSIPGYAAIVNSTVYPDLAVAIATAKFAGADAGGPAAISAPGAPSKKR